MPGILVLGEKFGGPPDEPICRVVTGTGNDHEVHEGLIARQGSFGSRFVLELTGDEAGDQIILWCRIPFVEEVAVELRIAEAVVIRLWFPGPRS